MKKFHKIFYPEKNIIEIEGIPASLHCHHFNYGLLEALRELRGIDGVRLFMETTEEIYRDFLKRLYRKYPEVNSIREKFSLAMDLYYFLGYGILDLFSLTQEGGVVKALSSYYATVYLAKKGRSQEPICYFTCGFIAAVMGVIFDLSLFSYKVKEIRCLSMGDEFCLFEVKRR